MPPLCDCCCEHVDKLYQQVSVMRKEIKNLRQLLDSALRSNRKHMTSLQSLLSNIGQGEIEGQSYVSSQRPKTERSANVALEKGIIQTTPIGYLSSCFLEKNGTPRQPTICGPSRAMLRIQQSVFNNPEHALVGLEQYSHVWVIFIFHKNGHMSYRAKVKPPRLNGQRVGVYSTRSPHRPNALGLTLAKLDSIVGDTIHLSDIDMIAGTPVLDIKPYIPDYDFPNSRVRMDLEDYALEVDQQQIKIAKSSGEVTNALYSSTGSPSLGIDALEFERESLSNRGALHKDEADIPSKDDATCSTGPSMNTGPSLVPNIDTVLEEVTAFIDKDFSHLTTERVVNISDTKSNLTNVDSIRPRYGEEAFSTIAGWIRDPPVSSLEVRFTPHAEGELVEFLPPQHSEGASVTDGSDDNRQSAAPTVICFPTGPSECGRPRFKFLRSPEEAVAAIRGVLSADPRSVYRRTRCGDRLFFFTVDTADVTCWFGQGFAEVLQVRPVVHNSYAPL